MTPEEHFELARIKLEEARPLIKLFGLDYDGTISDGVDFKPPEVMALVEKILGKGKSVAFVTASAATALKKLTAPFQGLLNHKNTSVRNFIAGGNGATLFEMKKDGLVEIYNHGMDLPQVLKAVEIGRKVYEKLGIKNIDLSKKGLENFRKILRDNWESYIPAEILDVGRPYNGEIFTEQAKVTFVLPKDKLLHEKLAVELNKELGEEYRAVAGDDTYIHITKKLEEDGKVVAIKTILKILGLEPNQVATFGDMPAGNDAGLLSFPYSFTNSNEFVDIKTNLEQPPYVLLEPGLSPVARIYKAVYYLLS